MQDFSYLDRNFEEVRKKADAAKARRAAAGLETHDVALCAAIKRATTEEVLYAHEKLGLEIAGENRVNTFLERCDVLKAAGLKLHFIGTLQSNKVRYIVGKVDMIESLDSLTLAAEIEKRAAMAGLCVDILIEINSGREENKSGVMPGDAADFAVRAAEFPHLKLRGFMTMAPKCDKKEDYNKYFSETYTLSLDIWTKKLHNIGNPILSMGMSDSFEPAIEQGADIVRVGTALFARPGACRS